MSQYDFIALNTVDSVLESLKKYGIAVIPGYLDKSRLKLLNSEFNSALYEPSESIYANAKHPTNTEGKAARLDPNHKVASTEFPELTSVFNDAFMKDIVHQYYAPNTYSFNEAVFLTNEFPCENQILPWHFDRVQSLKFWFNLTKTTINDGAMEYCPGSHWEGRYRAGYHLSQGVGVEDIPNDIEDQLIRNPIAIELNAGDLMIFDADGFHRGGVVGEGGERRVIRAHTYPKGRRYRDKPLTPGWWIKSPFNINKWFKAATTRVVGENVKENTINRKKHNILQGTDN